MVPIDLNLLGVFEALYDLRSVTRAAQRLNLTQSAVSHALRRLREALDDPLFVRAGGTLQPTARAQEMAPGVREGLARLRASTVPMAFDPATARRSFTIAAGSYFCALLIPQLIARARTIAPGVAFRIVPVGGDLLTELDEGTIELALGAFDRVPRRLTVERLFREDLVWVAARDNPLADGNLTQEALLRMPHLIIATTRAFEPVRALLARGPFESRLAQLDHPAGQGGDAGPVPAVVYDAVTAVALIARTDMVTLAPRRLAQHEQARLGLRILDIDEGGRGIDLSMIMHSRASADAGLAWLRAQLVELAAG